jgi:hypothetical protein
MCTGQGLFLNPTISIHPSYSTILERLKKGALLIDVGTFIGQDLRRLVVDGASFSNLYAVDIVNHWEIGFKMFRDRDKFHARYIETDILYPSPALKELNGRIDIIWVAHLLHQWAWDGQVMEAKSLVALSHLGTTVVGSQFGAEVAAYLAPTELMKTECFAHNPASFARMWGQVGEETGSKWWRTQAQFKTLSEMGWDPVDLPKDKRVLQFTVERVE